MSTTPIPLLPIELRLRTLEAQIIGIQPNPIGTNLKPRNTPSKPITRRVGEILDELDKAVAGSDALKSFITGYPQYLPLLGLNSFSSITVDQSSDNGNGNNGQVVGPISESDLLPSSTKLVMVLEAAQDIRDAERDLREVEILKKRGVEGAGQLESLLSYRNDLKEASQACEKRYEDVEKARKEVSDLLKRYNVFTSTVSDLFLDLHRRMEEMEDHVAGLERKKRRELAERF